MNFDARKVKLIVLTTLLFPFSLLANDADKIMQRVEDRERGKDFTATYSMVIESGSNSKERSFKWWNKEEGKSSKTLVKFLTPSTMRSSGLLTYSETGKSDEQWLYLSEAGKKEPRRIAATERGDAFLGSDFAHVDFERLHSKDFSNKWLRKEKWSNFQCDVIEMTPKDGSFPYEKIVAWIDEASNIPVRHEFYTKGSVLKVMEVKDLAKIDGIWTLKEVSMKNERQPKRTTLKMVEVRYNSGLDQGFFSQQRLKAPL